MLNSSPLTWLTKRRVSKRTMRRAREFLIATFLHPSELQYLPAWIFSYRKSPLSAHVPWLSYSATSYLEKRLALDAVAFEYGGGGSTLWLAQRVGSLTTVEHDPRWWAKVKQELQNCSVNNCTLLLCEPQSEMASESADLPNDIHYTSRRYAGNFENYVKVIDQFPNESLNVVLVDGRSRPACLLHAAPKVRRGGLLVLDNSTREDYEPVMRLLQSWPCKVFHGIQPHLLELGYTTCWTRPV